MQEVMKLESGNEDMGNIAKARGHRYIYIYRQANKAAKKAVTTTKALAMNELYE